MKNIKNINELKISNINDVNKKMLNSITVLKENNTFNKVNCFLKTYQIVTNEVINLNSNDNKYFHDFEELQNLDIKFAEEFFKPLNIYLKGNKNNLKETAWNEFFKYINRKDAIPFVVMLLGINSHINGDLAISLYKANVKNHKDFLKINDILINVTNKVLLNLIYNHKDILSIPAMVIPFLSKYEFEKTIVNYRNIAWKNYNNLSTKNYDEYKSEIYKNTNEISKEIIKLFHTNNIFKIMFLSYYLNNIQPKVIDN